MRLLITRPRHQAEETKAALTRLGFEVRVDPMLVIKPIEAALAPGPFAGVLVTSRNALDVLAQRGELGAIIQLPVFVVGVEAGERARARGFAHVGTVQGGARALAERVAAAFASPRRLLYLAGRERSVDLAALLARHGHTVVTHEVYRADLAESLSAETADAFRSHAIDAVLHYSARAAQAFLLCARKAFEQTFLSFVGHARHLCLSERIAEELRRAGLPKVEVAARTDQAALFALLEKSGKPVSPSSRPS